MSEGKATDLISCLTASPHSWLCSKGKPPAAEHAAAAGAQDQRARAACGASTQKTLPASKCKPTHADINLWHFKPSSTPSKEIRRTWEITIAVDQLHYASPNTHTSRFHTRSIEVSELVFCRTPPLPPSKTRGRHRVSSPKLAVDRWCCGGYWVRLFSSQSRADPPYSVVYRVHVCSALDASLKASLKDPLWKVNSITASWQEEEGTAEETVGMAMLLLSDAALHPANTPPSQTRAPPFFFFFSKRINKISRSVETLWGYGEMMRFWARVCVCVSSICLFFVVTVGRYRCWWWVCSSSRQSSCCTSGGSTPALNPRPMTSDPCAWAS